MAIGAVVTRHGGLDVLVNNAGYLKPGLSIEDTSLEEWQRNLAVNSDGAFPGCNHNRYGIRVNAVLPGPIDTETMRSNVSSAAEFDQMAKFLTDKYGMARIGVPDDIAHIVTFLASDQAACVTGAAFTVDGGQST